MEELKMKKTSKILAVLMAVALIMAMAIPAFAAETGSITINNAVIGQEYTIYKMADLESYDAAAGNYSYKVNDYWKAFFLSHSVNVDETNHIEYTNTIVNAANFAADALAYAKAGTAEDSPATTIVATSDTVKFENLPLGYYCVDSSVGAVCGLTNADPDGTINEKNGTPTIEKYVKEDSTSDWEHVNDDDLGATVEFQIEVTKVAGAINYVVGDKLSEGLTLDPNLAANISVKFGTTPGVADTDYVLYINDGTDAWDTLLKGLVGETYAAALAEYSFIVDLSDEAVAKMTNGSEVIINYSATLNEKAVVGNAGNPNEATLVYGDDPFIKLDPVTTITYVWDFGVYKYTNADASKKPLADAKFSVFESNPETDTAATAMWLYHVGVVDGVDVYKHVHNPSQDVITAQGLVQVITTTETGKFRIEGLDSGIYYMKEVEAPAGYHMLRTLVEVRIGLVGSYNDVALDYSVANTVDGYIEVLNSTGVVLPETGGIGTLIFITTGAILVLSMGVLLVVKKRMGNVIFTR